ncbi:hypothetical protein GGI43DRAFT_399401 [Trichoderma evansii]
MLLLAKLDLESLLEARSLKDMEIKVKTPLKDLKVYDHVYEKIMERVNHQPLEPAFYAKGALSWITCARRPLTIPELLHASSVRIASSRFYEDDLPSVQRIISICAGLVTIDKSSNIFRLFHYTAQEFFGQTRSYWFPDVKDDTAKICVTYLSFDVFKTGFSLTDAALEERLQSYQFYEYAAHN